MSKARLVTTIDSAQLREFQKFAQALNLSDAALLRKIIQHYLADNGEPSQARKPSNVVDSQEPSMQVSCKLTKGVLTKLDFVAKQQGMTRDTFLKSALLYRLDERNPQRPSIRELEPDDVLKQITVRVPNFLVGRLRRKARLMQMKISPWISCLIQTTLVRESVMTHNEIMHLNRSNRELASIGINLNQIARAMNQNLNHNTGLGLNEIEALKKAINSNKLAIRELVAVSQQNWGYFVD